MSLPNHEPNRPATFSVILFPEAEQPGAAPQLSATGTLVLKSRISCVICRAVEYDVINAANPPSVEVLRF